MDRRDQAIKALRDKRCRLTPQRLIILSVLGEADGHLDVREVLGRSKKSYPYMDTATVYRTLHLFKGLGVVTEVAMGDRLCFELTDPQGRHHHMVCRACGGAFDLSPSYLDAFRTALVGEFGFTPDLDNFTITGVCARCARTQRRVGRKAT
ncbi:MAG: Fur family transcriptional regulator [Dehalococcoidia bacterium]|nr:Fur family transcriptional regulator [Dehalococcoidia bacterium]